MRQHSALRQKQQRKAKETLGKLAGIKVKGKAKGGTSGKAVGKHGLQARRGRASKK